MNGASVEFG